MRQSSTRAQQLWSNVLAPLVLGLVWLAAAEFAVDASEGMQPRLWLAIGIYFGFVLIGDPKRWFLLALAPLLTDITRSGDSYHPIQFGAWLSDTAGIFGTIVFLRAAKLYTPKALPRLGTPASYRLLAVSALVLPLIATTAHIINGLIGGFPMMIVGLSISSDVIAVLGAAPVVLAIHDLITGGAKHLTRRTLSFDALRLGVLVASVILSSSTVMPLPMRSPYMTYPALVWIALCGRIGLTVTANAVTMVLMLVASTLPHPTLTPSPIDSTIRLHFLLGITILTHVILTIVVAERLKDKEALAEASRFKSRFLANMSHEIRSPLSAMLGFVDLILHGNGSPAEKREYAEIIGRNGKHLHQLIDQILDLSKVEGGKLAVQSEPFALRVVVDDVAALMRVRAIEKRIELRVRIAPETPEYIRGDAMRTKQILLNAVGNALKFTERGSVTLTVGPMPEAPRLLRCDVEDTGIGLTETEAAKLFHAFQQADPSIASKYGGTGLGLALSQHLARLMGGDFLLVNSQKGRGSLFRLVLDAPRVAAPRQESCGSLPLTDVQARPLAGLRLLIADDAADSCLLTRRLLEASGATVDAVGDGQMAVEYAQDGGYDLILLDIEMPRLDGPQAVAALKAQGYDRPIVALTGHAMTDEVERYLRSGFDGHLGKPIKRDVMIATIKALTVAGSSSAPPRLTSEHLAIPPTTCTSHPLPS